MPLRERDSDIDIGERTLQNERKKHERDILTLEVLMWGVLIAFICLLKWNTGPVR